MGFLETAEKHWTAMSETDRAYFLAELEQRVSRLDTWWEGKSVAELAKVEHFDDLPPSLRGRLILAVEEKGFSLPEHDRTAGAIKAL